MSYSENEAALLRENTKLRAEVSRLTQEQGAKDEALRKIAGGNTEPGVITDEILSSRGALTARMWTWSQETARAALAAAATDDGEGRKP